MLNIEMQTKVNYLKSLKYFYLTFFVLIVNLCIYGYSMYLKKLDELQDKIKAIKESRKALTTEEIKKENKKAVITEDKKESKKPITIEEVNKESDKNK